MTTEPVKLCPKCNSQKPLALYYKTATGAPMSACKACHLRAARARHAAKRTSTRPMPQTPRKTQPMPSLDARVLALCTGGPMSAARLVDETQASREQITGMLRDLLAAGKIRNDGSMTRPMWCAANAPKPQPVRAPAPVPKPVEAVAPPCIDWAAVRERERAAEELAIARTLAAVLDGGTAREIHRRRYPTTGAMRIPGAERIPADCTLRRLGELRDRGLVRLDGGTYSRA